MPILGSKEKMCTSVMEKMNSLRKDDILADVCIKVDDYQIKAHKSVLASSSEYFYSCFAGPLKSEDTVPEIDLSSVALDVESVEAVVDFLYTGEIDISDENLEAIMKLTSFLLIKPLEELCLQFMEQCCDLDSFMRYFMHSVDYMIASTESITLRTIKPRFHDWFIHQQLTRDLSPFHLKKLIEDYDIFVHCTEIDRLAFLVDWVLNGNTEEREEFACKILDGDVVPIKYNEFQSDDEANNDAKNQDVENQSSITEQQIDRGLQNYRELEGNDKQKYNMDQNNDSGQHEDDEKLHVNREPQSNGKQLCNDDTDNENEEKSESKKPDKQEQTHLDDDSVISNDGSKEIHSNYNQEINKEGTSSQKLSDDILKSLKEIKNKLQSARFSQEFLEKSQKVLDSRNADDTQLGLPDAAATHHLLESDVEHTIIAFAPKKLLKDFNKKGTGHVRRFQIILTMLFLIFVFIFLNH